MLKIRLTRLGKRNDPFYRIVVIKARTKRGGKAIENVGHWHPRTGDLKIDKAKISDWTAKGAQLSESVKKLFETKQK